jgi:hypothetical protein
VKPHFSRACDILGPAKTSERNGGDSRQTRIGAESRQQVIAIHAGHRNVGNDKIETPVK